MVVQSAEAQQHEMLGDTLEHVAQIGFGINVVELCRADEWVAQRAQRRCYPSQALIITVSGERSPG
jgi:hypothetical protein